MLPEGGTGKKKGLTDRVDIIPFTGQKIREKVRKTPVKPVENTVSIETMFKKKEKKVLAAPTGKLNTTNFSLKQSFNQQENSQQDEEIQDFSNRPSEPFGIDELKMAWKRFAYKIQNEGRPSLHSTLVKRDPRIIADNHILFELDNTIQLSTLENEKGELIQFVRKELNNWSIKLDFKVVEEQKTANSLYSGIDKFKALAEKNPNLNMLQRMFNLDIDF